MSTNPLPNNNAATGANPQGIDFKLEIVILPVSDPDRAKKFSGCSVIFGKNVTAAAPGSAQGLYLLVSGIAAARADLLGRGVGGATATTFASATDLASAFRRAEAAHGEHEKRTGGGRDANWPEWYAACMIAEQAGAELPQ